MKRRWWLSAAAWGMLLPAIAMAQSVYTWTDKHGVVHFSDEAPPGVKGVEKRTLETAPPLVSGQDGEATPGETPVLAVTPVAEPTKASKHAAEGPSEVVLTGRKVLPEGGARTRHLIGTVKNVGGEDATEVAVVIKVTDAGQGSECLTTEASVEPETLKPGEEGKFDQFVETPCFLGDFAVDVAPAWR